MKSSAGVRPGIPEKGQSAAFAMLSSKGVGEKPVDILQAFDVPQRRFAQAFDCSTHAAVIKLMMMTFGQHPAGMFKALVCVGDGYRITMKDAFEVQLTGQALQQAAEASRFYGVDSGAVKDANFMFAAFVSRKQLTGGYGGFEAALANTLEGETTQRCLQGMGVFGLAQFVSSEKMTADGAIGVVGTHHRGSALVMDGMNHLYGERHKADGRYGYVLAGDHPMAGEEAGHAVDAARSATPARIWSGFYQRVEGNGVTVCAIKAAILRFWKDPQGIYKQVQVASDGFVIVMRDSFRLELTHEHIRQAAAASNFYGSDPRLLNYANFLYAVSAKRAQLESNDVRVAKSYGAALQTLNDGKDPGQALRRLGVYGYMRESAVKELAEEQSVPWQVVNTPSR
ncbi:hypothetical protein [Pseudomonas sp. FP2309]|uniref:hypothetical protein n=1 Tax=Pseudomonas sp. FP2309 TaxID=2954091 RepID=UPI002734A49C|nr:hypothetical protein [Pseudomonas sp. FP2309]WLH66799.1 hypothetical protein PSH59_16880 [Pseudomonas sp. FP2309]